MDAILLLIRLGGDGSSEEKEAMSAIFNLIRSAPFDNQTPPIQNPENNCKTICNSNPFQAFVQLCYGRGMRGLPRGGRCVSVLAKV